MTLNMHTSGAVALRPLTAAAAYPSFEGRLLDAVAQAVFATDTAGRVLSWNAGAERLFGWTAAEAVGCSILELTPSSTSVDQAGQIATAVRSGRSWTGDVDVRRRDGGELTVRVTTCPLLDGEGVVAGLVAVSTDVTETVQAELAARFMATAVASVADAVVTTAADGRILSWNAAAEELYGWTAAEAVGRHVSLVVPPRGAGERDARAAQLRRGEAVRGEVERLRRDGSVVVVELTASPVLDRDGRYVGASSVARALDGQRAWPSPPSHAALRDELTGLPSRTLLVDRLEQLVTAADRSDTPLSVLFLDLDAFDDVNDAHGHPCGDRVLVEVAARLQAAVRPGDTVGRFGGDEFVVLLPEAGEQAAADVAAQLLAAVRQPVEVDGQRLHLTVSIGIATSPPAGREALLRAADAAVYDAKARGRGQVSTSGGGLSRQAEERLVLSGDLRDALAGDALQLVYQPVVDLVAGTVLGVEALLRWDHPVRGSVAPETFVALADKTGLGVELDAWVLRRACAEFARLRARGVVPSEAYLGVNVTASGVLDVDFPATVEAALAAAGLPASALVLEVAETGVVTELDAGVRVLTRLAALGVRLAIDDFGTGWSSLTCVRALPASILKLDRSFVARLHEDDADLAIAASVVELGRATRMTVVAEGVESLDQLAVLRRLGCGAGQGYLWTAGVPAADVPAALTAAAAVDPVVPARTPSRAPRQRVDVTPEHGLLRLWELHGDGASFATIAAALNREGYRAPTGQRWHGKAVARVLAEPALARSYDAE